MSAMRNTWMPREQREIHDELRERYGGSMSIKDVMVETGVKDRRTVKLWLSDVVTFQIGRQIRYRTAAVAKKMYEGMV